MECRRAHPPRPQKNYHERINRKERRLAKISNSRNSTKDLVEARGHRIEPAPGPLVVNDEPQRLKGQLIQGSLRKLGTDDIVKAKEGKRSAQVRER